MTPTFRATRLLFFALLIATSKDDKASSAFRLLWPISNSSNMVQQNYLNFCYE